MNSHKTTIIVLVCLLVCSAFIIGFLINRNFHIQISDTPDPTQQINLSEFLPDSKQIKKEDTTINYSKYEVKKGDTLDTIAKLFGTTKENLIKINNLKSENIFAGDIILIPSN